MDLHATTKNTNALPAISRTLVTRANRYSPSALSAIRTLGKSRSEYPGKYLVSADNCWPASPRGFDWPVFVLEDRGPA